MTETRAEVMARIQARWDELHAFVGGLSEAQLDQPLKDGWSTKVHLAHIASWERSLMGLLRGEHRADAMGIPRDTWEAHDTDAINAFLAAKALSESAVDVLSASSATHTELLMLLAGLADEDLERPYSYFQPDDRPYNGRPVVGWIHGNTDEHYEEHIGWLQQGLAK